MLTKRPRIVVTGAASGIGRAVAEKLAQSSRLILTDINVEGLHAVAKQIEEQGGSVLHLPCDFAKEAQIRELVDTITSQEKLDGLVHAAGVGPSQATCEKILTINLLGTAILLEAMTGVTNPNAALVLISSQASYFAAEWLSSAALEILKNPLRQDFGERINKACEGHDLSLGTEAYGLAKMGVRVLAEEAAVRLGEQGIRVNTISPGIIDTPMVHHEAKHLEGMDAMTQITPLGRWGQPAEIAEAAAFLLSRAASFVTSADLLIDGGSTKPMLSLQRAMANTSSS